MLKRKITAAAAIIAAAAMLTGCTPDRAQNVYGPPPDDDMFVLEDDHAAVPLYAPPDAIIFSE